MSDETMIDGGQGASEDWRSAIPEDLQNDPSLADIKDIAGLAKSYVHAQHMIGADKVVLPGTDASQEEKDAFFSKLGRPDTHDGYETPTENMPETQLDEGLLNGFYQEAHRIGLNKQQAAALVRWQAQAAHEGTEASIVEMESHLAQAQEAMRKEFGNAYEQNLDMAQQAAKQFGGEELIALLNSTGLGNEPAVIKAFANIGKAISNDEVIGGGGRQSFILSPAEAKKAIADKKRDPNFMKAYEDRSAQGHAEAVAEMGDLFKVAYPSDE